MLCLVLPSLKCALGQSVPSWLCSIYSHLLLSWKAVEIHRLQLPKDQLHNRTQSGQWWDKCSQNFKQEIVTSLLTKLDCKVFWQTDYWSEGSVSFYCESLLYSNPKRVLTIPAIHTNVPWQTAGIVHWCELSAKISFACTKTAEQTLEQYL